MSNIAKTIIFFCLILVEPLLLADNTSVPKEKTDQAIHSRITKILTASERYPNLKVEVSEGLVFLRGEIASPERKEWAKKIINETEGVVAIIDKLDTKIDTNSVFSPAQDEFNQMVTKTYRWLPYVLSSLIIFVIFGLIAFFVRKITGSLLKRRNSNILISQAGSNVAFLLIILLGLYLSLRSSGLSGLAFTILGGTGAIGIGIGLALKSSFENYASGLMISVREIFRRGELVEINGFEGIVQSVTTRGTTLMDYDGNNITIPNTVVFNATIKNYTRNPNMRAEFTVGIGYDDSIDDARETIKRTLSSMSELILKEPEPLATVDGLGASTVNLKVFFWFDAVKYSKTKIRSHVIQRVKEALIEAKISMPDDAREVVFTSPLKIINQELEKGSHAPKETKTQKSSSPQTNEPLDLENEVEDIKKQAELSEAPEKGNDLLL